MNLSEKSIKTGDNVKIKLTAAPNSLCALSAIDKSVTFMGERNSIDLEKVNLLETYFMFIFAWAHF